MRTFILFITITLLISCGKDDSSSDVTPISKYTLSVTSTDGGTVSSPGGSYNEGSSVTITATPNSEYLFENWSNGSTENPLIITVNQNISLTANFVKRKYPLTINIQGEGTVREEIVSSARSSDPTEYNSGTTVRLIADPIGDWVFEQWTGSVTETTQEITITLDEPKTVNVRFMRYFDYTQPSYFHFKSDFRFEPTLLARNLGNYRDDDGYITSVAYADFNLDGYYDVIYAKGNNTISRHPVEIYLNSGDNENFVYEEDYITNNQGTEGVRKSIIGDFNGDNKPDVFFADHGAEPPGAPEFYGAKQSILLSIEEGYQFNIVDEIPKEFNHGACSGDFDNDGDLDIFTSTGHFLLNDGNANFTLDDSLFDSNVVGIFTTEMVDINNDGFLDILGAGHSFENWDMDGPTIFFGNGSNFTDSNSYILNDLNSWGVVTDIDFVDLNNDGFKEIILNRTGGLSDNWDYFYRGWRIQIFENISGNEFIDRTEDFIDVYEDRDGRWTVWYRIEDIDGDGELELFDDDPTHQETGIDLIWDWNGSMFIKR